MRLATEMPIVFRNQRSNQPTSAARLATPHAHNFHHYKMGYESTLGRGYQFMRHGYFILCAVGAAVISGCSTTTSIDNSAGRATVYEDTRSAGKIQGVGVESQDILAVTDQMARDILGNAQVSGRSVAPRIILDSEYFANESSSRINKNMLTDRLRINLNRAANGKLVFVGREYADMIEHERDLKRQGVVDGGTIRATRATAGADFRLVGRIMSLDKMDARTQERSRYHQITFELVDLELGTYVWSGMYEFQKTAQDDIIYR